jgi:hypothetical protein
MAVLIPSANRAAVITPVRYAARTANTAFGLLLTADDRLDISSATEYRDRSPGSVEQFVASRVLLLTRHVDGVDFIVQRGGPMKCWLIEHAEKPR